MPPLLPDRRREGMVGVVRHHESYLTMMVLAVVPIDEVMAVVFGVESIEEATGRQVGTSQRLELRLRERVVVQDG